MKKKEEVNKYGDFIFKNKCSCLKFCCEEKWQIHEWERYKFTLQENRNDGVLEKSWDWAFFGVGTRTWHYYYYFFLVVCQFPSFQISPLRLQILSFVFSIYSIPFAGNPNNRHGRIWSSFSYLRSSSSWRWFRSSLVLLMYFPPLQSYANRSFFLIVLSFAKFSPTFPLTMKSCSTASDSTIFLFEFFLDFFCYNFCDGC